MQVLVVVQASQNHMLGLVECLVCLTMLEKFSDSWSMYNGWIFSDFEQ